MRKFRDLRLTVFGVENNDEDVWRPVRARERMVVLCKGMYGLPKWEVGKIPHFFVPAAKIWHKNYA